MRHPPSRELWRFCLARLREVRGQDARGGELTKIVGFGAQYTTRWRNGQMYVDRAEQLMQLARALDVDVMLLVAIACGTVNADQARRRLEAKAGTESGPSGAQDGAAGQQEAADAGADAPGTFLLGHRPSSIRGLALLISASPPDLTALVAALRPHVSLDGLAASDLPTGLVQAERHRPDLVFLDLDRAGTGALDACRSLSALFCRSQRRCRVVVGIAAATDLAATSPLMAGAAEICALPFSEDLFQREFARLEEKLGRGGARRRR